MLRSLGNKVVLLLVGFALVLCAVAIPVSHAVINRMNEDSYRARADEVAALVARSLDAGDLAAVRDEVDRVYHELPERVGSEAFATPAFDDYVAHYAHVVQMPEFQRTLAALSRLQGAVDVDCLYTAYVEPHDSAFVYLVDAAETDACPPGTIDPIYDVNRAVIDDPERGFPAYVTDTREYGWLVTAGVAVFDEKGGIAGYAFVDVSMENVKANQRAYVWSLFWFLLGITCVLGVVCGLLVRRYVSAPLNALSEAAACYRAAGAEPCSSSFASLTINTGDEIETLHKSMVTMEQDIDTYIESLLDTETKLARSRRQAETMSDLARTDALTGARNRLAFDQAVAALDMALAGGQSDFGIAVCDLNDLKVTNDTYGHECGNEALVRLVELLRETFAHSAIYRIGGDEFAIVLTGADHAVAGELVATFEDGIAALQTMGGLKPWERVSAAIGYASFDAARDSDATDVFGRADQAMYLRKREMKSEDTVRYDLGLPVGRT